MMILASLALVYALYAPQDPAQIYLFYSNDYMWNLGLWYLTSGISDGMYVAVMALSFIASVSGCYGTLRYLRVILDDEHEEVALRRKANDASAGVSMFIHGTKNELLASRILISRIEKNGYQGKELDDLKLMMDIFVFDTSDLTDALFEARLNNMLSRRDHLENFVKSLEANPKQFPDFGPRLAEIKAQTLIVWGRNDRFVPMDAGLRLLSGIAGSELHIFRDCGHWAQWEHADAFNQLVLNFLARP